MSERKFARVLGRPGSAAQVRETVSKAVRTKTIYQNKSLLVDCTPETEYSTEKFYTLQKIPNVSSGYDNGHFSAEEDVLDGDESCNLFVRECLKTYTISHLELVEQTQWTSSSASKPSRRIPEETNSSTPSIQISNEHNFLRRSTEPVQAPEWFWNTTTLSKETQLDEAGIALEGHASVIYQDEDLGDRFIQVKWDSVEERFWLIVWTLDVGRDFIVKIDLSDANPVWSCENGNKLSLPDDKLVFQSEQRRGLLQDLYTICSELGVFDKSAELASSYNVQRVDDVVQLFRRVTLELSPERKIDSKPVLKPKASSPIFFTLQLESIEFRLKTEAGTPVEPYYVSVCLFDVKNGRKISEDFHSTVDIHGKFVTKPKALFRVSECNDQIYAVVRVEKTLQPTDSDLYLRGNPDGKSGTRVSKNVTTSPLFSEAQRYRMPLCWSYRCLFRKGGSAGSGLEASTDLLFDADSSFSSFYKPEKCSDEELLKILSEIKKPERVSKLTLVLGSIKATVELSRPSLLDELIDKPSIAETTLAVITEFPSQSIETFSRFSHLLYVYPLTLNLNAVASKIRARNIVCRVFLRAEDDIDASPLDKNPGNGSIATYVLHHRTNPEWYSEIKLSLPVALDPRLHLLFQFLHISCSFDKANKAKQLENIIGYAWIPLLNKFRFIGGEHLLPVASVLPSGYLQIQPLGLGRGYSGPDIGWLEKCTLSVKLNLVSTVWTKCGSLGAFFAHAEKILQKGNSSSSSRFLHCDDENTVKSIRTLESIDLGTLRDFFPTIINQICNVSKISKTIGSASFKFLIFAFHSMIEAGLEQVVEEYTKLRFLASDDDKNKAKETHSLAEVLVDAWIDVFETGDGVTIASSLEHSKHIFPMILKSIAIQGFQCTNPEDSKLVKLVQLFTSEVVQRSQADFLLSRGANESFVQFISTAISVITQRHVVFATLNAYLACFGPGDSHKVQDFKFYLLQSIVEHPLFLELNSATGDEEYTRLDNIPWSKRHFLVATVMKQSRSGLGEVSNVRSLALKPIMSGLASHEQNGNETTMWVPWLRVVCDNLHRISTASLSTTHSSRCSSVSTILSATAGTLVQAALNKSLTGSNQISQNGFGGGDGVFANESDISRKSSLSIRSNGLSIAPSLSSQSSMTNISSITANGRGSGDRMSLDRVSITNCDYLDAISAIKMSNPAAATSVAPSTVSAGSESGTIVNENISNSGSGDAQSIAKDPSSDILLDEELKIVTPGSTMEADKSNVVLRRYDKLNEAETSQLLVSGLYVLKTMGKDGLRVYWSKSSSQERASLLQMIHLACSHFTTAKKNSTITRKKVVGIVVPPTMPPSPRTSLLPNKKWSSLPLKGTTDDNSLSPVPGGKDQKRKASIGTTTSDWKALNTEATFVCVDTLANLCTACKGENNEMRDVIRTTLDVAKASEDTRAMFGALENLYHVEDLASIVFAKGNEDLSHQLFCELLNGFGTSYLISTCVSILAKLFMHNANRTISQSLVAISSLPLTPAFVHNFRKSLSLLERSMSLNERSSFIVSITEKLNFIDLQEFEPKNMTISSLKHSSFRHLTGSGGRKREKKVSPTHPSSLPTRLATILNSLWLLKSCTNDYRVSELHLKLANSYSYFARGRLRLDSFDALKEEHLARKRFSEALLCELHAASFLARQTATPEVRKIMLGISQNLKDEFQQHVDLHEEEDTTEELIQRLESCVHFCEKSERYELMLEVYRILVDIQESLSDYAALEHSYKQMSRACSLIQNKRERFLATYYRVALYHPRRTAVTRAIEVFIYKEPNVTSLMEICSKVESAENAIIISGDTDHIPDDDNIYATITHVSPIPSESPRRKLWSEDFRRHQNVNKFTYDTPFTMKVQDKVCVDNKAAVHQQWKRRTTVHTEYTYPAVVSRLRVINSEEEDLSPIIVAIDDMQRRVVELRAEVHSMDIKRIQLRLQGSVSVQVNQGPLAYARAFLDKEHEFPIQDINKLKAIFRDFVECCGELLIRNGQLITPDQIEYQNQLESDYTKLCQTLSTVLGLPEMALNRMSRISVSSC